MAITPLDVEELGFVPSRTMPDGRYILPDMLRARFFRRVMHLNVACPASKVRFSAADYLQSVDSGAPIAVLSAKLRQVDEDLRLLEEAPGYSQVVKNKIKDVRSVFGNLSDHFMAIE